MASQLGGPRVPAWKRLGLELKRPNLNADTQPSNAFRSEGQPQQTPRELSQLGGDQVRTGNPSNHKASHVNGSNGSAESSQLNYSAKRPREPGHKSAGERAVACEHAAKRRKSVTFSNDTKIIDGKASTMKFNDWVGQHVQSHDSAEHQKSQPAPKQIPKGQLSKPNVSETTNHDSSMAYVKYLEEFHSSRDDWKFNKAKQNGVLKHALDVERVPQDLGEALIEYLKGLRGRSARDRLRESATQILHEIDPDDNDSTDNGSQNEALEQDGGAQKPLSDRAQALRRRLQKTKERLRKANHDDPAEREDFEKRLKRRVRAEEVLLALASSESERVEAAKPAAYPQRIKFDNQEENAVQYALGNDNKSNGKRNGTRKARRRTAVPDDDSSSVSDVSSGFSSTCPDTDSSSEDSDSSCESETENGNFLHVDSAHFVSSSSSDDGTDTDSDDSSGAENVDSSQSSISSMPPPAPKLPCAPTLANWHASNRNDVSKKLSPISILQTRSSSVGPSSSARPLGDGLMQRARDRYGASQAPSPLSRSGWKQLRARMYSGGPGRRRGLLDH